jgi:sortase family protein
VTRRRHAAGLSAACAAVAFALALALTGCGRLADRSPVAVAPPPPVDTTPVRRAAVASGPLVVRPAFTATMSIDGAPTPPAPPPLPKVPTHGIVLDQEGPVPVAAPVAVRIPAHDVVSRVVPVGVDQGTGELSVPADPADVGWYQFGATPGGAGAAVLAGHVDWKGRPGAFIHLDDVQPGERIEVDLGDGTSHAFVVAETHLILKTELPPDLFARTGPSKLVLITCGGEFDRSVRRYKQNVVVVATPAS